MSSNIDPKYAQIMEFYCNVGQNVAREFATFTIKNNNYADWKDFLDRNIHNIYHLSKIQKTCCQCSRDKSSVVCKRKILNPKQINLLLNIDGLEGSRHCVRVKEKHTELHCLCKVSVIPTSTIDSIDVTLLVALLRNCEGTKTDYEKYKDELNALIDVRNVLSHAPNTKLDKEHSDQFWGKLTTAVLKLAEISSAQPDDSVHMVQREIKESLALYDTTEQMRKAMQGWEYLRLWHEDLNRSMSISQKNCSGVQLAETLKLEKTSILRKIQKMKKFDEFWFVLRSPGYLEYYTENPGDEDVLPLHSINVLKYTEIKKENDNAFKVVIGSKKLKLKANSEESREKWIKAIQAFQNRQFNQKMFKSFYLPDNLEDECDNSAGQSIKETKESVSSEEAVGKSERMSKLFEVPKKPVQVVVAIDFGTTFCGAAFSTKASFESNPLRVENIQLDKQKAYHKTQTSVLFDDKGFVAFGGQAERKYKNLSLKGQAENSFFFRNFKMQLHSENLSKSMKIRTIDSKEMSCIIVIAACIEHIKEKAKERIKQMNERIEDNDIHWVITVPAIWSEHARQFMIKAAEKTGIETDNLSLALEPECAAVYCQHGELVKDEGKRNSALRSFRPGSKFMVVDLGGGTVDITVSEVLESGKMKEISKASGGTWGGHTINRKILDILNDIFGQNIAGLRTEEMNSYLELLADIESAKREYDDEDDFSFKLPEFLKNKENIEKLQKNKVIIGKGGTHILFPPELMKDIFNKRISEITKHVDGLLQNAVECSEIILVGGYASSSIVQTAFKKMFGKKFNVIIPEIPEIVVLTGAVIFGHSIEPITGRVAKYNYGLGIRASVDPGDRNLLIGNFLHKKIFHLLIEKERRMEIGQYVESCKIKVDDRKQLDGIELYITKSDNPKHESNINDFTKIGTIKFNLPNLRKPTTFAVSLWYDETEFRVMAVDVNTNLHFEGTIQYFEKLHEK